MHPSVRREKPPYKRAVCHPSIHYPSVKLSSFTHSTPVQSSPTALPIVLRTYICTAQYQISNIIPKNPHTPLSCTSYMHIYPLQISFILYPYLHTAPKASKPCNTSSHTHPSHYCQPRPCFNLKFPTPNLSEFTFSILHPNQAPRITLPITN